MDVFLFPSLWEGFGIVIIEALASGTPVVASKVRGASEALLGPFRDFGIAPLDVNAAFKNVMYFLQNPDVAKTLVGQCQNQLDKFDVAKSVRNLEDIYIAALS
jgi:glycosyltransferase involved in cell wall biosynthesis